MDETNNCLRFEILEGKPSSEFEEYFMTYILIHQIHLHESSNNYVQIRRETEQCTMYAKSKESKNDDNENQIPSNRFL